MNEPEFIPFLNAADMTTKSSAAIHAASHVVERLIPILSAETQAVLHRMLDQQAGLTGLLILFGNADAGVMPRIRLIATDVDGENP